VRYIPEAALGGIVLVAAAGLLSREEAQAIRRLRVRDWAFTMLTLAAVLVLGTLQGSWSASWSLCSRCSGI
jgi:MFS superfamily sulfate permease-like transporter